MRGLNALAVAIQAGEPVVIVGGPGIGKTTVENALVASLGGHNETVIASLREPSDFAGLPVVTSADNVRLAPPAWAMRLREAVKAGKLAVCFIDEISTAAPATQAALLRVVHEGVVGDLDLNTPDNRVSFVAAMNPPEQAAGGWELAPPLANRFCRLEWSFDAAAWIDGMIQGFPPINVPRVPKSYRERIGHHRSMIAAYVRANQGKGYAYPKTEAEAGKSWPSPRSWDMAARLMAACEASQAGDDTEIELVIGCVGQGVGLEFLNWRRELDLPDPAKVLADPDSFVMPDRGDRAFAVLASIAQYASANLTKANYLAAWKVFNKAASKGQKDIAAASVRTLASAGRKKDYLSDKAVYTEMVKYMKPFQDILQAAGILSEKV